MRPIDADALVELYDFPPEYAEALSVPIPIVVQNILDMPTLDYAPVVHGEWVRQDETYTRFQCSSCKSENHGRRWPFCPNCGAKMDGGKEDAHNS